MDNNAHENRTDRRGGIIAFLADAELLATTDAMAAEEVISRSDVARRAGSASCGATRVRRWHDCTESHDQS
jgi:hypothetical protein